MKKILTAASILAWAVMPASAERSRFSFALQGGLAGQEENNLRPGLAMGLGIGLDLGRGLSLTCDLAFWESRSRTSFRKLYDGTLTVSPLSLSLRYEFRPNAYFVPYVLGGGTYVFTRYRLGHVVSIPEVRIEQKVESGAALHLGLGVRVPLTWRWSFFGEASYILRRAPGQTLFWDMNRGLSRDDIWINLHIVLIKFGLRFYT